ncbi:unnamed protein product [Meloidogyne enterolobii]
MQTKNVWIEKGMFLPYFYFSTFIFSLFLLFIGYVCVPDNSVPHKMSNPK